MKQMLIMLSVIALAGLVAAYLLFKQHSRAIAAPEDVRLAQQDPNGPDPQAGGDSTVAPVAARVLTAAPQQPAPPPAAAVAAPAPSPAPAPTLSRPVKVPDIRRMPHLTAAMPGDLRPLEAGCKAGILVDVTGNRVLWSKSPDSVEPIASITKLMTVYVALDEIERNSAISLDSLATVSRRANAEGGSQLWLEAGAAYPYRDLMEAMMVQSANDAAYTVAENIGNGSADDFVVSMNRRARLIGLREARFYNPNGMPGQSSDEDNRASCYDLATLVMACNRFPIMTQWGSTAHASFTHSNGEVIEMYNTNRLVRGDYPGVNGMKTGWIRRSGYCIAATANRQGRELIAITLGFDRRKDRDAFVQGLLEWGYAQPQP